MVGVSQELHSNVANEKLKQSDLIKFLSIRVLDHSDTDFSLAFHQLHLDSQKVFFTSMANQNHLLEALNYVPKDIEEISIGVGTASSETIDEMMNKLCEFQKLFKVTFDLSQTTYYTGGVQTLISRCIRNISLKSGFKSFGTKPMSLDKDQVAVGGTGVINNSMPIHIVNGLAEKLLKESNIASIDFAFKKTSLNNYSRIYIVNDFRMQKVPEGSVKKAPLNSSTYLQNHTYEDKWTAPFLP